MTHDLRDIRTALLSATALTAAAAIAAPAAAEDAKIQSKRDGAWVAVSGEVAGMNDAEFTLDHGQGSIVVAMDEFAADDDAQPIESGDKVTVYGYVDDGFWQERMIEASSVWNERSDTFHYASGVEEGSGGLLHVVHPALIYDGPGVTLNGQVTDIDGREFTLITGQATYVEVDTEDMSYDPLDAEGAQQVVVGDRISVSGELETALFDDREMEAESLMVLKGAPYAGG